MAVYLPEKVFAVCTNQMDASPRKFVLSDLREGRAVIYGVRDKFLLI